MLQRNIYQIIVVKHEDGAILEDQKVVATSSESAMHKVKIDYKGLEVSSDETEFVILKLGSLRAIEEVKQSNAKA